MSFKPIILTLTVGTLVFATGCSDDSSETPGGDAIENPEGLPFVAGIVAVSDLCPGTLAQSCEAAKHPPLGATWVGLEQPEAGKLCVKGSIGRGGWAIVPLIFTEYEDIEPAGRIKVVSMLDADALGIEEVTFRLESPPTGGITLSAITLKQMECTGNGQDCRMGDFSLSDPVSKEVVNLTKTGTVDAPLVDFLQVRPENDPEFDTSVIDSLVISMNSAGPVDFCISDLRFLDAEGNSVLPDAT